MAIEGAGGGFGQAAAHLLSHGHARHEGRPGAASSQALGPQHAHLAEEASAAVAQSRSRRLDTADETSGSRTAVLSPEDDLADLLATQEEASMGRHRRRTRGDDTEVEGPREGRQRREFQSDKEGAYYDLLPDTGNPRAKEALGMLAGELVDHLHALGQDAASDEVLAFLLRRLPQVLPGYASPDGEPDPPVLYAALLYVEEMLRRRLAQDDPAIERVRVTIETMLLRYPSELRLGLLIANATHQFFANRLGSAIQARSMYRKEVLQHRGILTTFSGIVDKFGVERFGAALDFLLEASAEELAGTATASDQERLKVVRDDLYELVTLNTVMRHGEGMVERSRRRHPGCFTDKASIVSIMKFALKLAENPLSELASSVTSFTTGCVSGPIFVQCAFLQSLRSIALLMPDKVFELEAERRGYDTRGMNPKEHVVEMFDEAMEAAFEREQLEMDLDEDDEAFYHLAGAAG